MGKVLIVLICILVVVMGGFFFWQSQRDTAPVMETANPSSVTPSPTPLIVTPTPVPAQKGNTGKTPDAPIPVGTSTRVTLPSWQGGSQEITVLEAAIEERYGDQVYIKIRVRALEKTSFMYGNFALLVESTGEIRRGTLMREEMIAGSSAVKFLVFGIRPEESDLVLMWDPYLGDEEPLFFSLGKIGKKSYVEIHKL
jgi:hypothetical protein